MRASDADRERVADVLRHAAGEGRLTVDEPLEVGAVEGTLLPAIGQGAAPVASGVSLNPGAEGGAAQIWSVMGGATRKGRWRLAPRASVVNVMGGADLDFNQVELSAGYSVCFELTHARSYQAGVIRTHAGPFYTELSISRREP